MREKAILQKMIGSRFVIEILQTFLDDENLYFVFEHCQYGTLSGLINEIGNQQKQHPYAKGQRLNPEVCRLYAAELVVGIIQMQEKKVMHRDLKPENVLICSDFHIKIVSQNCL